MNLGLINTLSIVRPESCVNLPMASVCLLTDRVKLTIAFGCAYTTQWVASPRKRVTQQCDEIKERELSYATLAVHAALNEYRHSSGI